MWQAIISSIVGIMCGLIYFFMSLRINEAQNILDIGIRSLAIAAFSFGLTYAMIT